MAQKLNAWRLSLALMVLLVLSVGLIVLVTQHGSVKNQTPAFHIARWAPSPEQQKLLDEAASATPDYLSDELVPVLAAVRVTNNDREFVFLGTSNPHEQWLNARASALYDGAVTGDRREVDVFLSILSEPWKYDPDELEALPTDDYRNIALLALQNATLAGDAHRDRFGEFERLAIKHAQASSYGLDALLLLQLLKDAGGLSEAGQQTLDMWLAKPSYQDRVPGLAMNLKRAFFGIDVYPQR